MVKVFDFKAPESLSLGELSPERAEAAARKLADRALEALDGVTPVGVNAVSLSEAKADTEVWVQWTRACCDKRRLIDDFEEPIVADLDVAATSLPARLHNTHLESVLRTVRLQGPDHVAE
jgi:hypothetical protein